MPFRIVCVLSLFLWGRSANANDYAVKADGSGHFTTIQACANAAIAGDTCLVSAGTYNEHVKTASGGSSPASRVVFKAQGKVTMQGFDIRHPYITVDGFDVTGYAAAYEGLITIYAGGNGCQILNNTVRDGSLNVTGIYFYISSGQAASNCVVRNNRLTNLRYMFITTGGANHLFENNTLEYQNNWDFVRLFGSNHVFRRNVFRYAGVTGTVGNHPDFVQTFGQTDTPSENHLFEENWIGDVSSQFGQFNSGAITTQHELFTNFKNVTFRRNIIVNLSMNGNFAFPGARFEHNTFYRLAYTLSGLTFSGSLTRGDASGAWLKDNVFLEGGTHTSIVSSTGFYSLEGGLFSREVIGLLITNDPLQSSAATSGIYNDLQRNGYIDSNGKIQAAAKSLTTVSQFVLDPQYENYRQTIYNRLMQTVQLDASIRSSFAADYNYVAGAAAAGFPGKSSGKCTNDGTYIEFNFCESHGINGGDPGLKSLSNLLGPDGIPFTLDDGLKPLPTSRLCSAGQGGTDIGAYSCAPGAVFSGTTGTVLSPPTKLRIIK